MYAKVKVSVRRPTRPSPTREGGDAARPRPSFTAGPSDLVAPGDHPVHEAVLHGLRAAIQKSLSASWATVSAGLPVASLTISL